MGACAVWSTPTTCTAAPAAATATCGAGGTCDFTCNAGFLRCRDSSCGQSDRDFLTTVDGFSVDSSSAGFVSKFTQEMFNSRTVLTMEATLGDANRTAIAVAPICSQGANVRKKTMTANVFVEGPVPADGQISVGMALLDATTSPDANGSPPCVKFTGPRGAHAYCAIATVTPGAWTPVSFGPLPDSTEADAITRVELFMYFGGSAWAGAVHVDNLSIK
jgi:hypothetical protein